MRDVFVFLEKAIVSGVDDAILGHKFFPYCKKIVFSEQSNSNFANILIVKLGSKKELEKLLNCFHDVGISDGTQIDVLIGSEKVIAIGFHEFDSWVNLKTFQVSTFDSLGVKILQSKYKVPKEIKELFGDMLKKFIRTSVPELNERQKEFLNSHATKNISYLPNSKLESIKLDQKLVEVGDIYKTYLSIKELNKFKVSLLTLSPGAAIKLHPHTNDYEIYFFTDGTYKFCPMGGEHELKNNTENTMYVLSVKFKLNNK